MSHTLTFQTHNYADAHPNMQKKPWQQMVQFFTSTQKQSSCFFQSVFPPFHLQLHHFSLHPPISPSTPLQSLQSAVSYRIPLQRVMQHFKRSSAAWVCAVLWARGHVRAHFCYVQQKSSADTQHWCPQTIFMGYRVEAGVLHFSWSGTCCMGLEFWLRSMISHIGDTCRHGWTESN